MLLPPLITSSCSGNISGAALTGERALIGFLGKRISAWADLARAALTLDVLTCPDLTLDVLTCPDLALDVLTCPDLTLDASTCAALA